MFCIEKRKIFTKQRGHTFLHETKKPELFKRAAPVLFLTMIRLQTIMIKSASPCLMTLIKRKHAILDFLFLYGNK